MIWRLWLRPWWLWFAPQPPPLRPRWTPETWEQRCIGAAYQRHQAGYLPLEQALRMVYAYRTEYRAEYRAGPLTAGAIASGPFVGCYVPAVLSLKLLIETPSLVEER
jgi:hypothetical protein